MRKFVTATMTLLLLQFSQISFAQQQRQITGKVMDAENIPLPNVSVLIQGKNEGTQTNSQGVFNIQANTGNVLIVSAVGYTTQHIKIGNSDNFEVKLKVGENMLNEVTIAMDQKRSSREVGNAVQSVSGKVIAETQRENFINGLQGRVAGLTVTPSTGAAGASSGIVLRGFNTISGTNQPLFVVDGIIIDNQTLNSNSQSGSGIGLASDGNNRYNDNTNRIADLNPNDIENVTVLKGPEATALYGSQASSGAILITTKKAKATSGKILLNYDDNFRMQKVTRFAQVNNKYGPGPSNNNPTAPPLSGQFNSFGPLWKPGTQLYDNLHNFFQTGFSQNHNLSAEFGTKNVAFRASGGYFDDKGVVPNNTYKKYTFKLSNTTKIGKMITITPSVAYTNATNVLPRKGSNGSLLDLYAWPANNDIRNYQDENGNKLLLFNTNYNTDYDNPIWNAKNNQNGDQLSRWISTLGVDITPYSWLSLSGRFGYDTYKDNGYVFTNPESYLLSAPIAGGLDNYYRTYSGYNHTITATVRKNFGDFTTRLLVGTMWQDLETKQFAVYGTNMTDSVGIDGNMYKNGSIVTSSSLNPKDSNTTKTNTRVRLLRNYQGLPNESIFRELAYFGEASVGYKNVLFLTYSHRFESASPIPAANRNYNYPGVSLSAIVSDIFPVLKKSNVLNYAKLRGSVANTARLNDPYSNQSFFVNNFSSTTLPVTYTYGYTNANPYLKPETQKSYDIGLELRFLDNAITLNGDYYNTLCLNQIAQGYRASYATGFILNTQNAASLRNQGVELNLNVTPINKQDFNWTINFNFNHMWSEVLTLPASIGILNDFYNSDTYISNVRGGLIRGHSTGTITGSTYKRNSTGQILIDPSTGIPLVNTGNQLIGDRTPGFTLGTLNTFKYRNWSFSFLWDLKVGGDVYNGTEEFLNSLGKSERSAYRDKPVSVIGVLNDGLQYSKTPTKNTLAILPQYLSSYYTSMPDEEFIQKNVNWFRLRDITLNYTLPAASLAKLKVFSGLGFFITGNDLVLISNYYGADPAVNANNPGTGGVGGYGMDLGNIPTPLSLSFGIRANFK
ncbi:MAG TPA: SusC/RagA family TonB-linked outer membrane protein [Hanamia sp.]